MTFRPSVLPDRDNDILSTFTRSFERARQNRRADQADARAQAEHEARQEDREAAKQDRILEANLAVESDPGLSFANEFEIQQEGVGLNEVPTGSRFTQALGPTRDVTRPGVEVGRGPGGRSIFRSEEATQQGRREEVLREAELEFEAGEPERRQTRADDQREQDANAAALRSRGVSEEEIAALILDGPAARRRINAIDASSRREASSTGGETGSERQRAAQQAAIERRAAEAGITLEPGQSATMSRASAADIEDFFSDFPKAERDALQERVDNIVEQLSRIDENRGLLSLPEQNAARQRAFRDSGFGSRQELNAAQERLRAATAAPVRSRLEPTPGPAEASGLGGDEPRAGLSTEQREEAVVLLEGIPANEREDQLRSLVPTATDEDIDAILALVPG